MAKNCVQPGNVLDLIAPSGGVVSGSFYKIGSLFGVATYTTVEGAVFPLARTGVWAVPKATGTAWAEGDALYWDDAAKKFTKTAGGNTLVGAAVKVAASGDAEGVAILNQA